MIGSKDRGFIMGIRVSNWRTYVEGINATPQTLFEDIAEELEARDIAGLHINRTVHKEGGLFSRQRWYLVVQRQEYLFRISALPFSRGIILSWFLEERLSLFWRFAFVVPAIGKLLIRMFRPDSFARIDRAWAFQSLVHGVVLDVIDEHCHVSGVRDQLMDDDSPLLADFHGRALPNGQ